MRQVIGKGILTAAAATSILSLNGGYANATSHADGEAVGSPGVVSGNSVQVPVEVPVNVCGNSVDVIGVLNPAFGNKCANVSDGPKRPDRVKHKKESSHDSGGYGSEHGSGAHGKDSSGTHGSDVKGAYDEKDGDDTYAHGGHGDHGRHHDGGHSGAWAEGDTVGSPGLLSGNNVKVPVHVPVNACGNSANLVGLLNPAFGNECANGDVKLPPTREEERPPTPTTPDERVVPKPRPVAPVTHEVAPAEEVRQLARTGSDSDTLAAAAAAAGLLVGGGVLYRRGRAAAQR
ncbi:chaplin [Streptomyces sp. NPDC000410]|uniref:chaplin n=1 Tax=Streptomyces sp. NPDC000410 TaxID=3154254 RepID=UPI003321FDA8